MGPAGPRLALRRRGARQPFDDPAKRRLIPAGNDEPGLTGDEAFGDALRLIDHSRQAMGLASITKFERDSLREACTAMSAAR